MEGQGYGAIIVRAVRLAEQRVGTHHHAGGDQERALHPNMPERRGRQGGVPCPSDDDGFRNPKQHHANLRRHKRQRKAEQNAQFLPPDGGCFAVVTHARVGTFDGIT